MPPLPTLPHRFTAALLVACTTGTEVLSGARALECLLHHHNNIRALNPLGACCGQGHRRDESRLAVGEVVVDVAGLRVEDFVQRLSRRGISATANFGSERR